MSFQPISDADPVTVVHIICGVCALTVGPIALYSKARAALHRAAGYLWVFAIVLLAGTSFFIEGLEVLGALGRFTCFRSLRFGPFLKRCGRSIAAISSCIGASC